MQHLCSRTLKPSHTESFVDSWISSLEASRANPSAMLESVRELKTHDTDEEGNVWISQEVIDVIISSQNAEVSHDAERRCDH
jgi:hypothetical protein